MSCPTITENVYFGVIIATNVKLTVKKHRLIIFNAMKMQKSNSKEISKIGWGVQVSSSSHELCYMYA